MRWLGKFQGKAQKPWVSVAFGWSPCEGKDVGSQGLCLFLLQVHTRPSYSCPTVDWRSLLP